MMLKYVLLTALCLILKINARSVIIKQIIVLARHNLRTPLTPQLELFSMRDWPKWNAVPGHLTAKGIKSEENWGVYLYNFFGGELGLFSEICPFENQVYIYANAKHRTRESAKAFVRGAFPNCTSTVKATYRTDVKDDPFFKSILKSNDTDFIRRIKKEMEARLSKMKLEELYKALEHILVFNNSYVCKSLGYCSLLDKNEVVLKTGEQPDVYGPLKIGNSVADAFMMSYYEGMDLYEIGWGEIRLKEILEKFTRLCAEYLQVRFNNSAAIDVSRPLLREMANRFLDDSDERYYSMFVGHDSNILSILQSLGVKPFKLEDQFETIPIGGKIAFHKYYDQKEKTYLLKVTYMYQTSEQIRLGEQISLYNPPKSVVLEFKFCPVDSEGYCSFETFIDVLKHYAY